MVTSLERLRPRRRSSTYQYQTGQAARYRRLILDRSEGRTEHRHLPPQILRRMTLHTKNTYSLSVPFFTVFTMYTSPDAYTTAYTRPNPIRLVSARPPVSDGVIASEYDIMPYTSHGDRPISVTNHPATTAINGAGIIAAMK